MWTDRHLDTTKVTEAFFKIFSVKVTKMNFGKIKWNYII
jgi:hypothetical protein